MTAPTPTVFLAETHERFLKAVLARLPLERIIELHLFPSIKQGGMESGVAVVAAVPEGEVATPVSEAQSADTATEVESVEPAPTATEADAAEALDAMNAADATAEPSVEVATPDSADPDAEPSLPEMPLEALVSTEEACLPPVTEQGPEDGVEIPQTALPTSDTALLDAGDAERLEEAVHAIADEVEDPAAQAMAAASLELADLPPTDERPRRYTIYTARYRLVLKGPDRGKWEVSVTAEADAPLITVETVVRGVQRRAGESEEVGRWTGEELRGALRLG